MKEIVRRNVAALLLYSALIVLTAIESVEV